jgi:hypothetical protein
MLKKAIYLKTDGGLCNRLRSIDSAIILSKSINKRLVVIWENNAELGAHFDDLFEPIPNVEFLPTEPKDFKKYKINTLLNKIPRKYYSISPLIRNNEVKQYFKDKSNLIRVKKYNTILIETHHAFLYPEDFSVFKPKQIIENNINKVLGNFENKPTVGLHIRRTDHQESIKESPIALFEEAIRDELKHTPTAKFFLATDDNNVKVTLRKKFKDNIITNDFLLSRKESDGVANAVIDLFMLSKTNKIYGSFGSSFSETAKHIGKNELIRLKRIKS